MINHWIPWSVNFFRYRLSCPSLSALFTFIILSPIALFAQPKIKNVLMEGSGSPIVLLAGGTGDMSGLAVISKELSGHNKVIRMEHFNVQYATEGLQLPINYSVQMESEAVKNTLDSFQITEQIILVGHSYGGVIALDFALRHPTMVQALVLVEPPAFSLPKVKKQSTDGMQIMQTVLKELTPQSTISEEQVARFRCALLNCDSIDIRLHPQWQTWTKQKNRLRGLSVLNEYKIRKTQLKKFKNPVLIVTGTETVAFHKNIDQLLTKEFPLAKEVFIKGGHAIPTTAPLELVKAIKEFIR